MNLQKFVESLSVSEREELISILTAKPVNAIEEIAYYWFRENRRKTPSLLGNSVDDFFRHEKDNQSFTMGEFLEKGYLSNLRNVGKGSIKAFFDLFPEFEEFRKFNVK